MGSSSDLQTNDSLFRYRSEYTPDFAARYDQLVGWAERREREGSFFIDMLRDAGVRRVLDVACGTGFHAVQLAKAGFDVQASDGSDNMVGRTRENVASHGLALPVRCRDWRDLDAAETGRVDAVLCLGDSFSHLPARSDRLAVLARFRDILAPGGLLIIDHRNYQSIAAGAPETETERNYCCCGTTANISFTAASPHAVRNQFDIGGRIFELETYPTTPEGMDALLATAGFTVCRRFGDFAEGELAKAAAFYVYMARANDDAACQPGCCES